MKVCKHSGIVVCMYVRVYEWVPRDHQGHGEGCCQNKSPNEPRSWGILTPAARCACVGVCFSVLQCVAVRCSALQCVAVSQGVGAY